MSRRTVSAVVFPFLALASLSSAITFDPFGLRGEGGSRNGQSFTIGTGGTVYELDSFVYVDGFDLNGTNSGTSARLSTDAVPTGLTWSFDAALSPDSTDVLLTYSFTNESGGTFSDLRILVFLDAEIDEVSNTFFNEYGEISGAAGAGRWDSNPDYWQIDEPGFAEGTLYGNLLAGALSNSNAVPETAPDDVSMALGFALGTLRPGQSRSARVLVSEDAGTRGTPTLVHRDVDPGSETFITVSGDADVGPRELTNLLVAGCSQIASGNSCSYTGTALFSDGSAEDVSTAATWSAWGDVPAGTAFDRNVLTAGDVTSSTPITVRADYAYEGTARTGTMVVTLIPAGVFHDATTNVVMSSVWSLNRQTGTLFGSLTIASSATGTVHLAQPLQLAIHDSVQFRFMYRDGEMPDGDDYLDLTEQIETALGQTGDGDAVLDPGESITVTGIEVYSRTRAAPPIDLFEIWGFTF